MPTGGINEHLGLPPPRVELFKDIPEAGAWLVAHAVGTSIRPTDQGLSSSGRGMGRLVRAAQGRENA